MSTVRALLGDARSAVGLGILVVFALCAVFAPVLAPFDPVAQSDVLGTRFLAPLTTDRTGALHLLGTDALGRDLFARLVYGARISLTVGLLSVVVSVVLGVAVG